VLSLFLSDLAFTFGHWLMHTSKYLSQYHWLHHLCIKPTYITNVLFHPLDLAIEFAGPAFIIFALHFLIFKDKEVLCMVFLIFQLWYLFGT
jgi:sterol desaturase/sphingolipid hydroxylase (fatty acid hydroxylase superfamily)